MARLVSLTPEGSRAGFDLARELDDAPWACAF